MKKVELLAPVGKLENAYAAIENGADAIFVGGKLFNARQFAENFNDNELEEIINYCKLRGVKVYITVNTLIKNEELFMMYNYLKYLNTLPIDGVIVQDMAVVHMIHKYFPDIELHGSTQLSAHATSDVAYLKSKGFVRVVLARELQLEEIVSIKEETGVEVETFVHGALCYSYSGQCLLSSVIGGRSGNRGRCAQPCRMTYQLYKEGKSVGKELYLLSPKDISVLPILPQLVEAGIDSFKIEGRMKSPEYVASVVGTYRKYIDQANVKGQVYKVEEKDLDDVKAIFNRGGFSEGYYLKKSGKEMLTDKTPKNIGIKVGEVVAYNPKNNMATIYTTRDLNPGDGLEIWNTGKHCGAGISKNHKAGETFKVKVNGRAEKGSPVYISKSHELLKSLKKTYEKANRKLPITLKVEGKIGHPIQLELIYQDKHIVVYSEECLESAQNKPTEKAKVQKQLQKFGGTSFEVTDTQMDWEEDSFVGIGTLNALRRDATKKLEEAILSKAITKPDEYEMITAQNKKQNYTSVLVTNKDQLKVCLEYDEIDRIYWEWHYDNATTKEAMQVVQEAGKAFYVVLPYIMRNKLWERYKAELEQLSQYHIEGYLCRTYGQVLYARKTGKAVALDYNMNVMNNEAVAYWEQEGISSLTVSPELASKELKTMKGSLEKIIYGHLPVMTSEQCILGNFGHCKKHSGSTYSIKDRKESLWPIRTDCTACNMQLLTEKPLWIRKEELEQADIDALRLQFTLESEKQTREVLEAAFREAKLTVETYNAFKKPID